MFEDDICVDLSGVLDGKPNYANVPFSELFVGPCIDRPKVMDKGPNYATALLSNLCTRARCPPVLAPSGVSAVKVYGWEKESLQAKRFRLFFFFNFFFFFHSGMVVWTYL